MCKITEITGDLFSVSNDYSMAHCVSVDLRMGKGIAVKFRDKFGQIPNLKKQNAKVGEVAVLKDKSRFIYYLVTKQLVHMKPTYTSLFNSLSAMRKHMIREGVNKLAIPRIGCGLDGLIWVQVMKQLNKVFRDDDDLEIVVYNFVQK